MRAPRRFIHAGQEWFYNGLFGFFFQPVSSQRTKERIVKEGQRLYPVLKIALGD